MKLCGLLETVRGLDGPERFVWGAAFLCFAVATCLIASTPEAWPLWRNLGIIAVVIAVITITIPLLRLLDEGALWAERAISSCVKAVIRRIGL